MPMYTWRNGRVGRMLFVTILGLLLLDRVLLLSTFSFVYTGNDDTVYWQAAEDYSRGIFREPFFYGQDYGYMIEAFCAVPFLWAGVPHHVALPLATSLLALSPFVLLAYAFRKHGSDIAAALVLVVPLTLPIEHGMLTGMSRGFVGGLPFAAALGLCWFHPQQRRSFILFGTLAPVAFLANPNTVPLIFMTGAYLVLKGPFKPWWYVIAALPALLLFGLDHMARTFYLDHPEYIVHWMPDLTFSWELVIEAFEGLDRFFKHQGPIFWNAGWLWLIFIGALGVRFWRRERTWAMVLIGTVLVIVLLLGINKVHDGWETIFHSRERMFLSVPVVIALGLGWTAHIARWNGPVWTTAMIVVAICMVGVKSGSYPVVVAANTANERHGPVAILSIDQLRKECDRLADIADRGRVDVVIFVEDDQKTLSMQSLRTFGCPLVHPGMKDTFIHVGERRTWMYQKQMGAKPTNVLIYGHIALPDSVFSDHELERLEHDLLLVRNNGGQLQDILSDLGVKLKRHPYM